MHAPRTLAGRQGPAWFVLALLLGGCASGTSSATVPERAPATGSADGAILPGDTLPRRHAPTPTHTAITPGDLMTRVYIFADDSMLGRRAGMESGLKGTTYIANELRRLGAVPAGENGTFFQRVPLVRQEIDTASRLVATGAPLRLWTDYAPLRPRGITRRSFDGVQAIYGGALTGDTTALASREAMTGKLVIVTLPSAPGRPPTVPFLSFQNQPRFSTAAAVAMVGWEHASPGLVNFVSAPSFTLQTEDVAPGSGPVTMYLSTEAATRLLGAEPSTLPPGAAGRALRGEIMVKQGPAEARNVVAILPGTDPSLAGQYVALGAHSDHVGVRRVALEHDSLRTFNAMLEEWRAEHGGRQPSAAERASIRVNVDSLRRIRPPRLDSIYNGADDDASGSMGVLEVAEYFAAPENRPKRSLLLVWHTAEELGLFGAEWFTEHPTVPRDSIVAQLNVDMIGRGMPSDLPEGKPGYVQLIGSRRLSTELGDMVEQVARESPEPFTFDYQFDAPGHPEQYYCRSDHYMYARYGIPVVFLGTGDHRDYHQLTDEAQYINYGQLARVTTLLKDLTARVANLDHRVVVDKPKPDPHGECRQ